MAEPYAAGDHERWVSEPSHHHRGEFARDRARVVHSSALRRLAAKTQVLGPGVDDFARNRLTHSLEVAQIGRELALALGADPDVVDAACLAHDLGHPPFGHNGETALDEAAAAIGGFEGNAQTLRLLTRLEPKTIDPLTGRSVGLNLTRATLDACLKYPWASGHPGTAKFGYYEDDRAIVEWVRVGREPGARCLEAQVMDLADDIAYSVHDVEDALVAGSVELEALGSAAIEQVVAERARSWYLPDLADDEVHEALHRLQALPMWLPAFDGGSRALAGLKSMTSALIGRFSTAVEVATRAKNGPGRLSRYGAQLVVPRATTVEITALKAVAAVFVMTAGDRQAAYADERELLAGLVEALLEAGPGALEPVLREAFVAAGSAEEQLRAVIDQVASLTDPSARAWARRLAVA